MTNAELARMIDHTCLAPDATPSDVARTCEEAVQHGFWSVCVAPVYAALAVRQLEDTAVRVGSVAGFPHGNTLTDAKCLEARLLLDAGAREVDMVMAIGALKAGEDDAVAADVAAVAAIVHAGTDAVIKVILETAMLSEAEITRACRLAVDAGADFVKTSTGFGPGGATTAAVRAMRAAVGERAGVKAAGGIRDRATALAMIEAGATRIGSSSSVALLQHP